MPFDPRPRIILTPEQWADGQRISQEQDAAARRNRQSSPGGKPPNISRTNPLATNLEQAWHIYTGLRWFGGEARERAPGADVGRWWQVRHSLGLFLLVKLRDEPRFPYVFGRGDEDGFEFQGWLWGGEVKIDRWYREPDDGKWPSLDGPYGRPCFMVPIDALHGFDHPHYQRLLVDC